MRKMLRLVCALSAMIGLTPWLHGAAPSRSERTEAITIQPLAVERISGKEIEAGYAETEDAHIWSLHLPWLKDDFASGPSFNLYINADMKPTGTPTAGGADYRISILPKDGVIDINWQYSISADELTIGEKVSTRPDDFRLRYDGNLLHVIIRKDALPEKILRNHNFLIQYTRQIAMKTQRGGFHVGDSGKPFGRPFVFAGFVPQPAIWGLIKGPINVYQALPQYLHPKDDLAALAQPAQAAVARLARGEHEPVMFVLEATNALDSVAVRLEDGNLPESLRKEAKINYVGEVRVLKNGFTYDDALYPAAPGEKISPGKKRLCIWIDLHAPYGTPAGDYSTTIRLKLPAGEIAVPLEVTVWGFDLPKVPSLPSALGILFEPHNVTKGREWDYIRNFYQFLKDYRCCARSLLSPSRKAQIGLTRQGDQVILDWSEYDQSAAIYAEVMKTGFHEVMVWPSQSIRQEFLGVPLASPKYLELLAQYVGKVSEHLEQRGWSQFFHYCPWDEPRADERQVLARTMPVMREALAPGIPLRMPFHEEKIYTPLFGLLDYEVNILNAEPSQTHLAQGFGHKVWVYNMHGLYGAKAKFPDGNIRTRAAFWWMWRNGFDGFMHFRIMSWGGDKNEHTNWIYPVKDAAPMPAIQMALIREAQEDHDYLTMAQAAWKNPATPAPARAALLAGLIDAANLTGSERNDYDPDYAKYMEVRTRLGRLLAETAR